MRNALIAILVLGLLGTAWAADPIEDPESLSEMPAPDNALYRFLKARLLKCTGDGKKLDAPVELSIGGRSYAFDGDTLGLKGADPDGVVSLGVLGAIKDFSGETRKALDFYLDKFAEQKVDAIILAGDLAATEFEITQVVLYCAKRGLLTLALIGNTEGRTAFNRALLNVMKVAPNAVNFDFVRRVDLGGAVLISLPGYVDRKFVHQSGGCSYKPRDVDAMSAYTKDTQVPKVLVSHGPPAGKDKNGLDTAVEAGNVGDARMAGFMQDNQVHYGLFGHILEAGGRALDADGKPVAAGVWVDQAYLNVGSANPLPWQLNSGKLSCGMGAVMQFKDGKGKYTFIEHPCK